MRSNWWIPCFPSHLKLWLYGHVHIAINIGDFSIGKFSKKNFQLPINHLVQHVLLQHAFSKLHYSFFTLYRWSETTSSAAVVPCTEDHVVLVVS